CIYFHLCAVHGCVGIGAVFIVNQLISSAIELSFQFINGIFYVIGSQTGICIVVSYCVCIGIDGHSLPIVIGKGVGAVAVISQLCCISIKSYIITIFIGVSECAIAIIYQISDGLLCIDDSS